MRRHFRSKLRRAATILVVLAVLAPGIMLSLYDFDPDRLSVSPNILLTDRYGAPLRFFPDIYGERRKLVRLKDVPPLLRQAFFAAEDKRFLFHPGFDPIAMARAILDALRQGRIVSGASTLTQQLVRTVYRRPRTLWGKLVEISRAIHAERKLTKKEILEHYLNRVPMGNNIVGVGLAAEIYFGKEVGRLSPAECATLAALPKAPGRMNPYGQHKEILRRRRNWVLGRMAELVSLSQVRASREKKKPLLFRPKKFPFEAPHFVNRLRIPEKEERDRKIEKGTEHLQTTLNLPLQHRVEAFLASHRERLAARGARQAAAIVVDNRNLEILAWSGSMSYSKRDSGYNDGITALRSPGSTLKPFLYALALDQGILITQLLEDTHHRYRIPAGEFLPENFDRRQFGPVDLRIALGNSLNLSAVRMLEQVGVKKFYDLLDQLQLINDPSRGPEHYGLGLVVGNPEVTLEQLAAAFAALANGGRWGPLRPWKGGSKKRPAQVFSPQAAFIIARALADPTSRILEFASATELDFPFRVAWKTGTSTQYRDCWIVGFTPEYTVAVWVGNFEGDPTWNLTGATAAGPILADILRWIYSHSSPSELSPPPGLLQLEVCGYSGMLPTRWCRQRRREWFLATVQPRGYCTFHRSQRSGHELPARYAGWLAHQGATGIDLPYRVSTLGQGLARAAIDTTATPGTLGLPDAQENPLNSLHGPQETRPPGTGSADLKLREFVGPPAPWGNRKSPPRTGTDKNQPNQLLSSLGVHLTGLLPRPIPERVAPPPPPSHLQVSISRAVWSRKVAGVAPRITYPLPGDRYVIHGSQKDPTIRFRVSVDQAVPYLIWFLDGVEIARQGMPYDLDWPLAPGRHRVRAATPDGSADEVEFSVE